MDGPEEPRHTRWVLRPVFQIAGFLGGGVAVFAIRDVAGPATDTLIRDATLGAALAQTLGDRPVALMRGHGAVTTEVNARLQAEAMRLGSVNYLTAEEAAKAAAANDPLVGRPWDLWKRKALGTP
jgi:hypothetical protein